MQTVGKLLRRKELGAEPPSECLICTDHLGVEIELEGFTDDDVAASSKLKYWSVKADNSLRNSGVEFVTRGGLGGATLESAIVEVSDLLQRIEFNASWRCSTHMHINMLDFSLEQVVKFILAYVCVESIMFDFCSPSRKHSNFCVPLNVAKGQTRDMVSMMRENWFPPQHGSKYMALNMLPIGNTDLGTLEFRGSHALTTKDELFGLANRLLSIKNFVRNFPGSTEEMIYHIETGGWQKVLSAGVHEGYVPDYEEFEKSVVTAWGFHKEYVRRLDDALRLDNPVQQEQGGDIPVEPLVSPNWGSYMQQAQATSVSTNQGGPNWTQLVSQITRRVMDESRPDGFSENWRRIDQVVAMLATEVFNRCGSSGVQWLGRSPTLRTKAIKAAIVSSLVQYRWESRDFVGHQANSVQNISNKLADLSRSTSSHSRASILGDDSAFSVMVQTLDRSPGVSFNLSRFRIPRPSVVSQWMSCNTFHILNRRLVNGMFTTKVRTRTRLLSAVNSVRAEHGFFPLVLEDVTVLSLYDFIVLSYLTQDRTFKCLDYISEDDRRTFCRRWAIATDMAHNGSYFYKKRTTFFILSDDIYGPTIKMGISSTILREALSRDQDVEHTEITLPESDFFGARTVTIY